MYLQPLAAGTAQSPVQNGGGKAADLHVQPWREDISTPIEHTGMLEVRGAEEKSIASSRQ
jgi:hypothetical protein